MASKLKRYSVQVQSGRSTVDTILKLTPQEAERIGATEYVKDGSSKSSAGKGRTASNKARAPRANKARTPRNKAESKTVAKPVEPTPQTPAGGVEDATDPGASE